MPSSPSPGSSFPTPLTSLFPFLPPQVRPPYRTFSPIRFPYHSSNSNNIPADCRPTCRSSVCIVFLICNCSYRYIAIDLCSKGSQVLVPSFILSSHLYILCGHRSIAVTTPDAPVIPCSTNGNISCLADHKRQLSCHHEATQSPGVDTGGVYWNR